MYKTGQRPGKGRYICKKCQKPLYLEDENDTIPTCPLCFNNEFIDGTITHTQIPISLTSINQI